MVTEGYLAFHPSPKKPDIELPPLACDSHCHVFGPAVKFPYSPTSSYLPVDAPKQTLFERHRFLGFSRAVIVQASCHGTDNAAMVDALEAGGDAYRGIAILRDDVDAAELRWLDAAGVRGVRFNFVKRLKAQRPISVYKEIIAKVARLGWHIVVYFDAEDLAEIEPFLRTIPVPVIIDHMGRVPVAEGIKGE
ncbi:MAG: amidohydrolase family protein, partial [Hyphomicrobiales bacterium]|nr:amidohydrolase family protein [Hyphomicrobiales bacterium]